MGQAFFAIVLLAGCCWASLKGDAAEAEYSPTGSTANRGELHKHVARVLEMKGFLCGAVVDVKPLKAISDTYWVLCTARRGAPQQVRYIVDVALLTAFEAN